MLGFITTSHAFWWGLSTCQTPSLHFMVVRRDLAYIGPPYYILCFVKGVMHWPKSLINYDVIFEYFLNIAHILDTFIFSFAFKSLKFSFLIFYTCHTMKFYGFLIEDNF
jgi:hypothetical protein